MPRKQSYLILAVIVALQCGAMFYWASRKSGFFIDEYYTFEYVQNINDHKDHIEYLINSPMWKVEEWLPVEELKTRFTIEEGESVLDLPLFKSVKKFKPSIECVAQYRDLDAVVHYHQNVNSNAYYSADMLSDQSSVFPICRLPSSGLLPELPDKFLYWASRGSTSQKVLELIEERGYTLDLLCDTYISIVYLCDKNGDLE